MLATNVVNMTRYQSTNDMPRVVIASDDCSCHIRTVQYTFLSEMLGFAILTSHTLTAAQCNSDTTTVHLYLHSSGMSFVCQDL